MAKCEIIEPAVVRYRLELTTEEAGVLAGVCDLIGGHPDGPRGKIAAISRALDAAGVIRTCFRSKSGSVYI